jgi:hypothetical protein
LYDNIRGYVTVVYIGKILLNNVSYDKILHLGVWDEGTNTAPDGLLEITRYVVWKGWKKLRISVRYNVV